MDKILKLIVLEKDARKAELWNEVFAGIDSVSVSNVHRMQLQEVQPTDAEIMAGIFVHERFGGRPKAGVSQIIHSQKKQGTPEWVITTPPFRIHNNEIIDNDGNPITYIELVYKTFVEVFVAIDRFNADNPISIRIIGFVPELCGVEEGRFINAKLKLQIEAVKRAYLEWLSR